VEVEKVREKKQDAEQAITNILMTLEAETEGIVSDVEFDRCGFVQGYKRTLVKGISIRLEM
jgi:hypothetical protein